MTVARPPQRQVVVTSPVEDGPREVAPAGVPLWLRVGRATVRPVRAGARTAVSTWQHSLQLRVATTTLLITGAVVLIIGVFIVRQVSEGVLKAKHAAAIQQADVGLADAEAKAAQLAFSSRTDRNTFTSDVQSSSLRSAGLFSVTVKSLSSTQSEGGPVIPAALRRAVQGGNLATQYAPVPVAENNATAPGLIVGEPVNFRDAQVELYYLFPLTAEQKTIDLLRRTVLIGGLGLVLLVVAIAMLVTRQVVRPVRVAARTAGRLAAGELSQRISVRGTDDIARLGRSFNDMAGSLQRQIRRLEDLSRVQRRFTSDVSHELRTPLTTIRMASELLHEGRRDFPPELARSAELLNTELDRFESLLGDLLEISRYDAGVANLESETADIRGVVASSVRASQVLAGRHGSEIVVDVPPAPVTVEMDSRRVERILRNLLGNALDHGEGRTVEVRVGYDDDAVAVTVRDHGVGLRPGEAGLVFNRFWRGDPSRSRLTGGTGLGLAISLEDARLHDGWLQAWGERGKGAQFRLTLPRRAGHTILRSPLPLAPDEELDR